MHSYSTPSSSSSHTHTHQTERGPLQCTHQHVYKPITELLKSEIKTDLQNKGHTQKGHMSKCTWEHSNKVYFFACLCNIRYIYIIVIRPLSEHGNIMFSSSYAACTQLSNYRNCNCEDRANQHLLQNVMQWDYAIWDRVDIAVQCS